MQILIENDQIYKRYVSSIVLENNNDAKIDLLIQEGILSPFVKKAQQLSKKYLLPAAVVLSLMGVSPQGQAQEPKQPTTQEELNLKKDMEEAAKILAQNTQAIQKATQSISQKTATPQQTATNPQEQYKKQFAALDQMINEKDITPQRGAELKALLNQKLGYTQLSKALTPLEKEIMLANIMLSSQQKLTKTIGSMGSDALAKFKQFQNSLK